MPFSVQSTRNDEVNDALKAYNLGRDEECWRQISARIFFGRWACGRIGGRQKIKLVYISINPSPPFKLFWVSFCLTYIKIVSFDLRFAADLTLFTSQLAAHESIYLVKCSDYGCYFSLMQHLFRGHREQFLRKGRESNDPFLFFLSSLCYISLLNTLLWNKKIAGFSH